MLQDCSLKKVKNCLDTLTYYTTNVYPLQPIYGELFFTNSTSFFIYFNLFSYVCTYLYLWESLFIYDHFFWCVPPSTHLWKIIFYRIYLFSFVYTHFICQNLFLFIIICKNIFLFVIICGNHFLFVIICENLFLTIIICQNLFLFAKTYFHLCALIFICENVFFYDHLWKSLWSSMRIHLLKSLWK